MRTSGNLDWKYGRTSEGNLRVFVCFDSGFVCMGFAACLQVQSASVVSTPPPCMLPRLANRVAVPFFSPPAWLNIPMERNLEIAEAEERMAESLIHTEVTVQDTL